MTSHLSAVCPRCDMDWTVCPCGEEADYLSGPNFNEYPLLGVSETAPYLIGPGEDFTDPYGQPTLPDAWYWAVDRETPDSVEFGVLISGPVSPLTFMPDLPTLSTRLQEPEWLDHITRRASE